VAGAHLKDVQAKIADLRAMERVLRQTVAECASGRSPDCPLIESLSRENPAYLAMLGAGHLPPRRAKRA
jgi:MerR family mercuric resistance operon transcriptional regulator